MRDQSKSMVLKLRKSLDENEKEPLRSLSLFLHGTSGEIEA